MKELRRIVTEAELDADGLAHKCEQAALMASAYDPHARNQLATIALALAEIAAELASLAGHPRDVPDYGREAAR